MLTAPGDIVGDGSIMRFILLINGLSILVYMMNRHFTKRDWIILINLLRLYWLTNSFLIILTGLSRKPTHILILSQMKCFMNAPKTVSIQEWNWCSDSFVIFHFILECSTDRQLWQQVNFQCGYLRLISM